MNQRNLLFSVFLLCAALLAGCGRTMDRDNARPTEAPAVSASPAVVTPDVSDGMVRDRDGIITPDDTGTPSASPSPSPKTEASAMPGAGNKNG